VGVVVTFPGSQNSAQCDPNPIWFCGRSSSKKTAKAKQTTPTSPPYKFQNKKPHKQKAPQAQVTKPKTAKCTATPTRNQQIFSTPLLEPKKSYTSPTENSKNATPTKNGASFMAGLDRHANFYAIAKTKPIVTAVVCFLSTQKWALESPPEEN
jgi:hypothetical protein